jgi:hypothetical protein
MKTHLIVPISDGLFREIDELGARLDVPNSCIVRAAILYRTMQFARHLAETTTSTTTEESHAQA